MRPYRLFGLQKDVVEKLMFEMLKFGIIQPSHNPFVFPVKLVKNKDNS
jgi:hypothetical protein